MMPRPLRVAHVNDVASVGTTLVAGLRALGNEADLLDPARPGSRLRAPWRGVLAPARLAALVAVAPRLWFGRYDIVHFHFAWKAVVGLLAGRPLIVHCHGSDVRNMPVRSLRGKVTARVLRRAAAVYYATPDLGPWVLPFRADARFLPNPIDTALFRPTESIPARDVLVGVRLDPIKGTDDIARVLEALVAARPSTTVTIVDLGSEVGAIHQVVGPQAELIPSIRHDAMPGLLARHRIVIGQFRVGTLGNYELESLAAGLPVAAAFRFLEAYDEPPPLVPGSDPAAIGECVARLLDDDDARAVLASAGRRWVIKHHERGAICSVLADAYRALLAGPGPDEGGDKTG